LISAEFPYSEIAAEYEEAGADAISVLTEPNFFMGNDYYLAEIAEKVKIPVLRKDFIIEPYQIYQARALGASAVLLICSILTPQQLKSFVHTARSLGLSALVEVHGESEVDAALNSGAKIIGINNRNLNDFTVDITNSVKIKKYIGKDTILVAESGIKTRQDIVSLEQTGVHAVLIGETLMVAEDKKKTLAALRN
jgi:indole-3-glycerol phosphate synthase